MIKWHHSSTPATPTATAIVARRSTDEFSDTDWMLIPQIYIWRDDHTGFVRESDGRPIHLRDFWYCLEDDLLAHLAAQIALRENGHPAGGAE